MSETVQVSPPRHGAVALAAVFEIAIGHHEAGRMAEAEAMYRRILEIDPAHADSLHLLGLILHGTGDLEGAAALIGRAIEIDPTAAPYYNNLGNLARDQGQLSTAAAHYRRALELRPLSTEIASNLGTVLRELGRMAEAVACYRRALESGPGSPDVLYNLGNALADLSDLKAAEACYRACLGARPDHVDAAYNLANLLIDLRRWTEAEALYRTVLGLVPDHAAAHNNLGTVLQELGQHEDAERCYRRALELNRNYADASYNLGCICQIDGRLDEAAACYERALAIRPDYGAARLALCMAQLPVLYRDELEVFSRRSTYLKHLKQLCADAGTVIPLEKLAEGAGASQPFFLAYQGYNDRALQQLYGGLLCRTMAARFPAPALHGTSARPGKVRLGIVSGFFHDHTIWKLFIEGWLKRLDRSRFEVLGYHTGTVQDAETELARDLCARFVEGGRPTSEWRRIIVEDRPQVLLYPEIGMDPMAAQLGALRLAPVQCVSWGHPETTGYDTMDAFLSNALMEPPGSAAHYTEDLVLLPNLSTYYDPGGAAPAPAGRAALGLRESATVYWSGQAIYKYLPQFDGVFPEIARGAGDCQFVFIEFAKSRAVTNLLRTRLDRAFAEAGLEAADYCVFLPPMDQQGFLAAVGEADVVLDTIGWSGGRSTLDCLGQDPAIVTLEGGLMRGRHTAAILRRMQATETIAQSVEDYVSTAVHLGQNPARRRAIRDKVSANKQRVYCDGAYVAALEAFVEDRARRALAG
jgi:predicted O-linked N-acetylglucosamine transferase (SPINDLY family)